MRLVRTAILTALMATQAFAPSQAATQDDPRLVSVVYDPAQIVKVIGRPGVQATITFGEDEKIENVAVGDSQKWQITPNKRANLLFARPLEAAAVTNMTVVTDKRTYLFDLVASAKDRPVYMLSFTYGLGADSAPAVILPQTAPQPVLASAPQPVAPAPAVEELPAQPEPVTNRRKRREVAAVAPRKESEAALPPPASAPEPVPAQETPVFRSAVDDAIGAQAMAPASDPPALGAEANAPDAEAPAPEKRSKRERQARKKREVVEPVPTLQQPSQPVTAAIVSGIGRSSAREAGAMNFAWVRKGKKALLPQRVYDDGRMTYLIWGERQKMPTVLVIDERGEEASPNLTTHENSVAIAAVPGRIVLRSQSASATLENLRQMASGDPIQGRVSVGQSPIATPAQVNE